jgi:hypothetical protein
LLGRALRASILQGAAGYAVNLIVTEAILVVGGVLLAVGGLTSGESPRWAGRSLVIAGVAAAVNGGLRLAEILGKDALESRTLLVMGRLAPYVGGFMVGVLVTLFVAGEIRFRKKKR